MDTKLTVKTTVSADVEKAWDFWTKPEHITNWNFAAEEWHCPFAENDLRPGGKFNYRMEARDGSMGFDFEGTYDEVIHHKKIAYSMSDGRQVVIDFEQHGNETTVTEAFDPEDMNPHELQQTGWQIIIDNYKKLVEEN